MIKNQYGTFPEKNLTHICKICGKVFKSGAALGGHMLGGHDNPSFKPEVIEKIRQKALLLSDVHRRVIIENNKLWTPEKRQLCGTKGWIKRRKNGKDKHTVETKNKISATNCSKREVFRQGRLKQKLLHSNTSIELKLQNGLRQRGISDFETDYPFHMTKIDIAFPLKKIAIYADGDYWHTFSEKIVEKDERVNKFLLQNNWKVLRFWECEINSNLELCLQRIEKILNDKVGDEIEQKRVQ